MVCVPPRPPHCSTTQPRPRLYWYPAPLPPWKNESNWRWHSLRRRIELSPHHEPDGACADFYIISNHLDYDAGYRFGAHSQNSTKLVQMFQHLASTWPWWNRTTGDGQRRHLLLTPCDHGPGDCMYTSWFLRKRTSLPPAIAPQNPQRMLGYITPSGATGPTAWFRPGVDVRLPQEEGDPCSVFCGVPLAMRSTLGVGIVRQLSPWAARDKRRERLLTRRRRIQFFWSGWSSGSKGFRGSIFRHHLNRSRWLLRDTSPEGQSSGRASAVDLASDALTDTRSPSWVARAMSNADFCYSPLGQHHGDSDRYLPAVLYGCVPVFIKSNEAGPFREVIPWERISLQLTPADIPILHLVLNNISHEEIVRKRRAMQDHWSRMLWPSVNGTSRRRLPKNGLGSGMAPFSSHSTTTERNAFTTFVEVLRQRLDQDQRQSNCSGSADPQAARPVGVTHAVEAEDAWQWTALRNAIVV